MLTRYVYSNHLQSASLELDENAEIISYEEYHPYGTSSYQAKSNTINAVAKRYRYTGKERDEESGLYYHGARYYIPWLCRWSASDPLERKYAGWSPYHYVKCNPVMDTDSTGMGGDKDIKTQGTTSTGAPLGHNYHPTGFKSELSIMPTQVGDEVPYTNSNTGTGSFSYIHDSSSNMDFTIMNPLNSEAYYSWVNSTTGKAEFFYNDSRNKDANGNWTGEWVKYETAEQQRARVGVESAEILGKGIASGIVIMVAAPAVLELAATATVGEGVSTMGVSARALTLPNWVRWGQALSKLKDLVVTMPLVMPQTRTKDEDSQYETFYRAMSTEEYRATGGLIQHRTNSDGSLFGEGPYVTDRLSYAEKALYKFADANKYDLIVAYKWLYQLKSEKTEITILSFLENPVTYTSIHELFLCSQ